MFIGSFTGTIPALAVSVFAVLKYQSEASAKTRGFWAFKTHFAWSCAKERKLKPCFQTSPQKSLCFCLVVPVFHTMYLV